jgi:hypothetical protein
MSAISLLIVVSSPAVAAGFLGGSGLGAWPCAIAGGFVRQWQDTMDEGPAKTEIDTRLDTLRAAHRALDQRIAQLASEGTRDEVELQRLKKQKLALKDRIAHLESARIPDIIA